MATGSDATKHAVGGAYAQERPSSARVKLELEQISRLQSCSSGNNNIPL
jgi:hypothetical protein